MLVLNGLVGDSFSEVDREEDSIAIAPLRKERSFQQQACVVERLVGQTLWVELAHRRDYRVCKRRSHPLDWDCTEAALQDC